IELLVDLLPLRTAFTARNIAPPLPLLNAIDRMMPMLRFFRHGDGNFALFNGMGPTPTDLLTTILAYDDARGAPPANAPHSGYPRPARDGPRTLNDTPSCRFIEAGPVRRMLYGTPMIAGPRQVGVAREEQGGVTLLRASHDGYADIFNVVHERVLMLSAEGRS